MRGKAHSANANKMKTGVILQFSRMWNSNLKELSGV